MEEIINLGRSARDFAAPTHQGKARRTRDAKRDSRRGNKVHGTERVVATLPGSYVSGIFCRSGAGAAASDGAVASG